MHILHNPYWAATLALSVWRDSSVYLVPVWTHNERLFQTVYFTAAHILVPASGSTLARPDDSWCACRYSLVKGIGDGEPIASERFCVGGHEWVSNMVQSLWLVQFETGFD